MILGMKTALLQRMEQQEEQMHRSEPQLPLDDSMQHQHQQHRRHSPHHQQQHHHHHHNQQTYDPPPPVPPVITTGGGSVSSGGGSFVDNNNHHHQHHQHHHGINTTTTFTTSTTTKKRIRLKCVVLGAAGAGKTSILRRYFSGTFQPPRKPTLGADFYSGRVNNPVYQQTHHHHKNHNNNNNNNDHHNNNNSHEQQQQQQVNDNGDQIHNNKNHHHHHHHTNDELNQLDDDGTNPEDTQRPRGDSTTSSTITRWVDDIQTQPTVLIQVWDTAGKERYAEQHGGHKMKYTANLGDSFFRNVDAAMLVYDVTSSTSFTQLLKWHADLTARFQVIHNNSNNNSSSNSNSTQPTTTTLPFPVIIVGNKMDVLKGDQAPPRRSVTPKQRDVMGLKGQFRGKDSRYEYRVSLPPTAHSTTMTTTATTSTHSKQHHPHHRYLESSTYMATGETWTSDGSYLHSLLTTEDGSHPDREMVLLWCMRNGLKHFEVSALEGTGINNAMEELVSQALETRNQHELAAAAAAASTTSKWNMAESQATPATSIIYQDDNDTLPLDGKSPFLPYPQHRFQRNPSLDLQARYAPHDDQCCRPFAFLPPWWWCRKNLKAG